MILLFLNNQDSTAVVTTLTETVTITSNAVVTRHVASSRTVTVARTTATTRTVKIASTSSITDGEVTAVVKTGHAASVDTVHFAATTLAVLGVISNTITTFTVTTAGKRTLKAASTLALGFSPSTTPAGVTYHVASTRTVTLARTAAVKQTSKGATVDTVIFSSVATQTPPGETRHISAAGTFALTSVAAVKKTSAITILDLLGFAPVTLSGDADTAHIITVRITTNATPFRYQPIPVLISGPCEDMGLDPDPFNAGWISS